MRNFFNSFSSPRLALFEREVAHVFAVELEEIERLDCELLVVVVPAEVERVEVGEPSLVRGRELGVDDRGLCGERCGRGRY